MVQAWVVVRESGPGTPVVTAARAVPPGRPITVGRDAELPLGVSVPDAGVSRVAVTATAEPDGWRVANTSRNGLVVHPWGLAPQRAGAAALVRWPLVAVRVLGADPAVRHWVLLECDRYLDGGPVAVRTGSTVRCAPPRPLTDAEQEALAAVFAPALAWPPADAAEPPRQLKQAARGLGVSTSAVKVRLEGARAKAEALGLDRRVGVTDPDYLHVLVAAGYVQPPAHRCGVAATAAAG